jgi:hypothetical protein
MTLFPASHAVVPTTWIAFVPRETAPTETATEKSGSPVRWHYGGDVACRSSVSVAPLRNALGSVVDAAGLGEWALTAVGVPG